MKRKSKSAWGTVQHANLNPKAKRDSWGNLLDTRAHALVHKALMDHEHKASVVGGLGSMCGICYGNLIELVHAAINAIDKADAVILQQDKYGWDNSVRQPLMAHAFALTALNLPPPPVKPKPKRKAKR